MSMRLLVSLTVVGLLAWGSECPAQGAAAPDGVEPAAAAPQALIAADTNRTVFTPSVVAYPAHEEEVVDGAISADGRWVATLGGESHVKIADAKTGELKHDVTVSTEPTRTYGTHESRLNFSPDGKLLAVTARELQEFEEEIKLRRRPDGKIQERIIRPKTQKF